MEQSQQEVAIKRIKFVVALLVATSRQPIAEIVAVTVKKSLSLHEIHEHQPIKHHGGVPFPVATFWDAGDELKEGRVLALKLVVEAFGDALHIEGCARSSCNIWKCYFFFLVKREFDGFEFLK